MYCTAENGLHDDICTEAKIQMSTNSHKNNVYTHNVRARGWETELKIGWTNHTQLSNTCRSSKGQALPQGMCLVILNIYKCQLTTATQANLGGRTAHGQIPNLILTIQTLLQERQTWRWLCAKLHANPLMISQCNQHQEKHIFIEIIWGSPAPSTK